MYASERREPVKKVLKITGYVVGGALLTALVTLMAIYYSEIRTMASLTAIEGTGLYTMEYFSDYHFDDFLKTGAKNSAEYYKYINSSLIKGEDAVPEVQSSSNACSAFTFRDKGGNRYMARNFDREANPVMLLVTSPKNAYKSISTVNLNTLGFDGETQPKMIDLRLFGTPYFPSDGINEKGISVSMLWVKSAEKQNDPQKSTIGVYAAVRLILDYADTVDKAVELIDSYNMFFDADLCAHLFVADSKGNSEIIEFVGGETHVIENFEPFQVTSNFNLAQEEIDEDGYVRATEYISWLRNPNGKCAYDAKYGAFIRYDLMRDTLYNSSGIMSTDEAFKLLEDVASPSNLQYSVVYSMKDFSATIITDNDWERKTTAMLWA